MTTTKENRITPDNALVINPKGLGIQATGEELEDLFIEFTNMDNQNPWQFELAPDGGIIAMPPTHYPSGMYEINLSSLIFIWANEHGGIASGPTLPYRMPVTGGILVPDAAWTSMEHWASIQHEPGRPIALCPDLVVEIRSGSNNLAPLQAKMRLYMDNGSRMGWLIDPPNRQVHIHRSGQDHPETLDNPTTVSGEDVMPGFTLDVARWIFDWA